VTARRASKRAAVQTASPALSPRELEFAHAFAKLLLADLERHPHVSDERAVDAVETNPAEPDHVVDEVEPLPRESKPIGPAGGSA
jgi:hypothetical protein